MPAAQQQVADDFLTSLRQATSIQHTQLESTTLSKKLLDDAVTTDDYSNYLLMMEDVIRFCEEEIFPLVESVVTDIEKRRKLSSIQNDINYLHANNNALNHSFQPKIKTGSTAYALGYMYVIEGSTLGGRVILKHLKNRLSITETEGGTFFAGYSSLTGSFWKEFLQTISNYVAQTQSGDDLIEGAQDAFNAIYYHFSEGK